MRTIKKALINIGGHEYLIVSDDNYLEAIKNGFEPQMVRLFRTVAGSSQVILDIGANIGCTTLLFSEMAGRVAAFEPSPTTFAFLEKNISRADVDNVLLQNIGLGAEAGQFPLTVTPDNRAGAFISNQVKTDEGRLVEKITIRTLDEVTAELALEQLDFIKIDVEGFEEQVLRGAKETLARFKPLVVLELNHWCLNAFQRTSIPDFFDFLRARFPILLAVDGSSYMDLHDDSDSYIVMYHHILHLRFPNILAAFDEERLADFRAQYSHGFVESPPPAPVSQPAKPGLIGRLKNAFKT